MIEHYIYIYDFCTNAMQAWRISVQYFSDEEQNSAERSSETDIKNPLLPGANK